MRLKFEVTPGDGIKDVEIVVGFKISVQNKTAQAPFIVVVYVNAKERVRQQYAVFNDTDASGFFGYENPPIGSNG